MNDKFHLLQYMDMMLQLGYLKLQHIRKLSPLILHYILNFRNFMNNQQLIIQIIKLIFHFLRSLMILMLKQLRMPNMIHIILNL